MCSAEQYSSSDQSMSANFSSSPSSGGTLTCEGPPPPAVPCDIEELILNEIALTRQSEYRLTNGQFVEQAIVPGTRVISLRGIDHAAPRHDRGDIQGNRRTARALRILCRSGLSETLSRWPGDFVIGPGASPSDIWIFARSVNGPGVLSAIQ